MSILKTLNTANYTGNKNANDPVEVVDDKNVRVLVSQNYYYIQDSEKLTKVSISNTGSVGMRYEQIVENAKIWKINHNLQSLMVNVICFNTERQQIFGAVSIIDENTVHIEFNEENQGYVLITS